MRLMLDQVLKENRQLKAEIADVRTSKKSMTKLLPDLDLGKGSATRSLRTPSVASATAPSRRIPLGGSKLRPAPLRRRRSHDDDIAAASPPGPAAGGRGRRRPRNPTTGRSTSTANCEGSTAGKGAGDGRGAAAQVAPRRAGGAASGARDGHAAPRVRRPRRRRSGGGSGGRRAGVRDVARGPRPRRGRRRRNGRRGRLPVRRRRGGERHDRGRGRRRLVGWGGGPIFRHGARGHAPRAVVQKTLGGLRRARLVACGPRHAVGRAADGTVFTWGAGARGRLGHGDCRGQLRRSASRACPTAGSSASRPAARTRRSSSRRPARRRARFTFGATTAAGSWARAPVRTTTSRSSARRARPRFQSRTTPTFRRLRRPSSSSSGAGPSSGTSRAACTTRSPWPGSRPARARASSSRGSTRGALATAAASARAPRARRNCRRASCCRSATIRIPGTSSRRRAATSTPSRCSATAASTRLGTTSTGPSASGARRIGRWSYRKASRCPFGAAAPCV